MITVYLRFWLVFVSCLALLLPGTAGFALAAERIRVGVPWVRPKGGQPGREVDPQRRDYQKYTTAQKEG